MHSRRIPETLILVTLLVTPLLLGPGCSDTGSPATPDVSADDPSDFGATVDPGTSAFVIQRIDQIGQGVRIDLIGDSVEVNAAEQTVSIRVAVKNVSEGPLSAPVVVRIGRIMPATVVPVGEAAYDYSALLGEDAVLQPGEQSGPLSWTFRDPGLLPFTFAARIELEAPPLRPHIGGIVFLDENQNGRRDGGEQGLGAGTVTLTRPDGSNAETTPNLRGRYVFEVSVPGLYTLRYGSPFASPGECFTTPHPLQVVLVAGPGGLQSIDNADFGFLPRPCDAPPAAIMVDRLDAIEQDPYRLLEVQLRGDVLALRVGFSGCRPDQPFTLYVSNVFMESMPVQTMAVLAHDNRGELCDAYFERTLLFDLAPLRRAYVTAYGAPGMVVLRLRDYQGTEHPVRFGP